jgi:hypothetical protein
MHTLPTKLKNLKRPIHFGLILFAISALSACDRLGFPDPTIEIAAQEANAKATGSACRHAGRAIEDCYSLNPNSSRAAVYAGWKEMNDYMRENKIEEVKPTMSEHADSSASASASSENSSASAHSAEASSESTSEH